MRGILFSSAEAALRGDVVDTVLGMPGDLDATTRSTANHTAPLPALAREALIQQETWIRLSLERRSEPPC